MIPGSQYPEITIDQPGYLESVPFGSLDTNVRRISNNAQQHVYASAAIDALTISVSGFAEAV